MNNIFLPIQGKKSLLKNHLDYSWRLEICQIVSITTQNRITYIRASLIYSVGTNFCTSTHNTCKIIKLQFMCRIFITKFKFIFANFQLNCKSYKINLQMTQQRNKNQNSIKITSHSKITILYTILIEYHHILYYLLRKYNAYK